MRSSGLKFKTYVLILFVVVFGPLGNVLLSKGMKSLGVAGGFAPSNLLHLISLLGVSSAIWLGFACLVVSFASYMLVLSWADYTYAQPASAISYGVVTLLGHLLLGEVVDPMAWAGVAMICLGVFIVAQTSPRTTLLPLTVAPLAGNTTEPN
jgi:drug/metabolite transporter (DMT)-like permease